MAKMQKYLISRNSKETAEILGFDQSVGIEWELRYQITARIIEIVKENHLKITEIAKKTETSRARITRILKGDTEGISLDVLMRVLGSVGQRIKVKFLNLA